MKRILLSLAICSSVILAQAQIGFSIPLDSGKVEIPFERSNNLIIIPITFNKEVTLKFILDTSVEYTILSEKSIGDALGMNYLRKIPLGNVDGKPSYGYSANGIQLSIGAASTSANHSMMVLENDFMNLSNLARMRVNGVIGYDLFGSLIVHIDHSKRQLILYPKNQFDTPRGYSKLPLEITARRAFVSTDIVFENWDRESKKFQLKTGATHTMLFNSDSNLFHLPARKLEIPLGTGPSGPIEGYVGRVREMRIADFRFENVIASFTKNEVGSAKETGSIGMGILSRFDLIFDYSGGVVFLRKNRSFSNSFEYDLSGLKVDASISNADEFMVSHVLSNSPASRAGVKIGDRVISIQGEKLSSKNSNELLGLFLQKEGKRIKMQIKSGNQEIREVSFTLASMI